MFFLFDYIDPLIFLISLCVGLFYTYVTVPYPQVVIKYPTPFNAGKITYVDKNNVCYKYQIEQVNCPLNKSQIKTYQFQ
jgi:hypothetical protein